MPQTLPPAGDLSEPTPALAEPSVAAVLASLTGAPEALLVIVDPQGHILDVRKGPPAWLAANLVAAAQSRPPQSTGGDAGCPSDAGPFPWRSA